MATYDLTQKEAPSHQDTDKYLKSLADRFDQTAETVEKQMAGLDTVMKFGQHTTGAKREKMDSLRYDYMPAREVNEAYARVGTFGAKKYDTDNWKKGLPHSQITASLQRHIWAYMDGEETDPESGLSHADHILWNAVALVYGVAHNLCDDRFKNRLEK